MTGSALNALRAERIKFFSVRAPWWCGLLSVLAPIGFTAAFFALAGPEIPATPDNTQLATGSGRTVALVLAVLAATSDANWGTLRLTFQAVPTRTPVLLAKGVVVVVTGAILGLLAGVGSWGVAVLVRPDADLGLHTGGDWRVVAGRLVPHFGPTVYPWLPFFAASQFGGGGFTRSALNVAPAFGPWGYLAYFGGICLAFLAAGAISANRRDA